MLRTDGVLLGKYDIIKKMNSRYQQQVSVSQITFNPTGLTEKELHALATRLENGERVRNGNEPEEKGYNSEQLSRRGSQDQNEQLEKVSS